MTAAARIRRQADRLHHAARDRARVVSDAGMYGAGRRAKDDATDWWPAYRTQLRRNWWFALIDHAAGIYHRIHTCTRSTR